MFILINLSINKNFIIMSFSCFSSFSVLSVFLSFLFSFWFSSGMFGSFGVGADLGVIGFLPAPRGGVFILSDFIGDFIVFVSVSVVVLLSSVSGVCFGSDFLFAFISFERLMFLIVFVIGVIFGVVVVCFVALRKRGGSQTCCTDKSVRLLSYYYLTSESLLKVMSLSVSFVSSTDTVTVFPKCR